MRISETKIKGIWIIDCDSEKTQLEERVEYVNSSNKFNELNFNFVQDNEVFSRKGVLRGIGHQIRFQQDKLIRVVKGKIFDVIVDTRKDSKTYGEYVSFYLDEDDTRQIYIEKGLAHGYLAMSNETLVNFSVTEFYKKNDELGIIWNDKKLNIDWPLPKEEIILSERDSNWFSFSEFEKLI